MEEMGLWTTMILQPVTRGNGDTFHSCRDVNWRWLVQRNRKILLIVKQNYLIICPKFIYPIICDQMHAGRCSKILQLLLIAQMFFSVRAAAHENMRFMTCPHTHTHTHSPCWISHNVASVKGVNGSGWIKCSSIPREDGHPTSEQHFTLKREQDENKGKILKRWCQQYKYHLSGL